MTTSIQLYRTRVVTVQAVQWTGENLEVMQTFLAPDSPFVNGRLLDPAKRTLGVYVPDDDAIRTYPSLGPGQVKMAHAGVGDWIVKYPSGRIGISPSPIFDEYYQPIETQEAMPEPAAGVEPVHAERAPFGLGAPIEATHPRALADREPATETDEITVSER